MTSEHPRATEPSSGAASTRDVGSAARVTAAVCTRNRGDRITTTVESLLAGDLADFELLVLDQSPGDETERALDPYRHDPRLRYVRSDTVGIGTSRHLAVELATGEYVAFTDDDCAVPADWLSTISDLFDRHPQVGMLYCNVLPAPYDPSAGFVPVYEREGEHLVASAWAKCTARGIGAGMAVRRSIAIEIGNFDRALGARFPGVVGEEGDLALRMILNGHPVLETDRTHVVHDGFRTWAQGRELTRRNFIGIGLVCAKPLRCGRWSAISVAFYEGIFVALLQPLGRVLRGRRPGLRAFWYFWVGFLRGWRTPIDRRTMNFRLDESTS